MNKQWCPESARISSQTTQTNTAGDRQEREKRTLKRMVKCKERQRKKKPSVRLKTQHYSTQQQERDGKQEEKQQIGRRLKE